MIDEVVAYVRTLGPRDFRIPGLQVTSVEARHPNPCVFREDWLAGITAIRDTRELGQDDACRMLSLQLSGLVCTATGQPITFVITHVEEVEEL